MESVINPSKAFNPKLYTAKQTLYPPFFSPKPLANTILDLTKATPDKPFQASMTLYRLLYPRLISETLDPSLLEACKEFYCQYTPKDKPLFYPPEYFLKSFKAQDFVNMKPETQREALSPFGQFIQESVIKRIINLNIDAFLSTWLAKLLQISENCHQLPTDEVRTRDGNKGIFYRMGFPPKFIENLYEKLHKMQSRLSTNQNAQLSPFDLLIELEPEVGKAYQGVFLQESTVEKRFTKLTAPLYKSTKGPKYNSLKLLEILKISPEALSGKHFTPEVGPAEALQIVTSQSKVYKRIFCYMNLIKGRVKIEIEDILELQGISEEEFIKKKLEEKDLQIFALKNCNVANLTQILVPREALKALILPEAKNLTQGALKILGKNFPNLESLVIGDNENLKFLAIEREDFPNLKHLNVSHCPNLIYLRVESPALEALEIGFDKNLKTVGLTTTELKHLDCREEKIDILYVNKGIKKVEVVGTTVQDLEEKMVRIELWKGARVIEKLLMSNMDEKGTQEAMGMMFPEGIKKGLERLE